MKVEITKFELCDDEFEMGKLTLKIDETFVFSELHLMRGTKNYHWIEWPPCIWMTAFVRDEILGQVLATLKIKEDGGDGENQTTKTGD